MLHSIAPNNSTHATKSAYQSLSPNPCSLHKKGEDSKLGQWKSQTESKLRRYHWSNQGYWKRIKKKSIFSQWETMVFFRFCSFGGLGRGRCYLKLCVKPPKIILGMISSTQFTLWERVLILRPAQKPHLLRPRDHSHSSVLHSFLFSRLYPSHTIWHELFGRTCYLYW